MPKVLFFAPDAGIVPHYGAMAQLARSLAGQGVDVDFVECNKIFQRCTPKVREPVGLSSEGRENGPCTLCRYVATRVIPSYGLKAIDFGALVPPPVNTLIQQLVAKTPDAELIDFTFDGLNIGRLVLHDFILTQKILSVDNLSQENFLWLREAILTCLITLHGIRRLFLEGGYTHVAFYGQYNQNMIVLWLARQFGITCSLIGHASHFGVDRRYITFSREETRRLYFRMTDDWMTWGELPLESEAISMVAADMRNRFKSSSVHVYSPPKTFDEVDFRKKIGLSSERKTLVAFSSSLDEIFAQNMQAKAQGRGDYYLGPNLWPDQVSWFRFLVNLVKDREELQLVIRIHPREDANRRERARSKHLELLEAALCDLPSNVRVIWPSESISSYDLLEVADIVLNAWSYIGMEAARFGVPVIAAFPSDTWHPPNAFFTIAATVAEYKAAVMRLLERSPDFQQITQAFRWYHYSTFAASVSVEDIIPSSDFHDIHPYRTPARAPELARAIVGDGWIMDDYLDARRKRLDSPAARAAAQHAEAEAIRVQMRGLIRFLLLGETDPPQDGALTVIAGWPDDAALPPSTGATLYVRDGWCRLLAPGIDRIKYSPMVARLGLLAAQRRGGTWASAFNLAEEGSPLPA